MSQGGRLNTVAIARLYSGMVKELYTVRVERGNQLLESLKTETDRGRASVGDALLDEILKDLFRARLVGSESQVEELLRDGQILGTHGGRLKVAFHLGWIRPDTHIECRTIHKIRNKMAHELDVDSFDHGAVRDLLDGLKSTRHLVVH